jgi:hypothetical protein
MADYTFLQSETFDDGAIVRLASAGHAGERPLQLPPRPEAATATAKTARSGSMKNPSSSRCARVGSGRGENRSARYSRERSGHAGLDGRGPAVRHCGHRRPEPWIRCRWRSPTRPGRRWAAWSTYALEVTATGRDGDSGPLPPTPTTMQRCRRGCGACRPTNSPHIFDRSSGVDASRSRETGGNRPGGWLCQAPRRGPWGRSLSQTPVWTPRRSTRGPRRWLPPDAHGGGMRRSAQRSRIGARYRSDHDVPDVD